MFRQSLSLKRSAFIRLMIIMFSAVLVFYAISLYLNAQGVENVRFNLRNAINAETQYIAGELNREADNLVVFQQELASDPVLLRYAIAYDILSPYQRIDSIKKVSYQLHKIKRFSSVVATAEVFLPKQNRTITTDQALLNTLDETAWGALSHDLNRKRVTVREWENRLYLIFTQYERDTILYSIVLEMEPEVLLERIIATRANDETGLLLLYEDERYFAGTAGAYEQFQIMTGTGAAHRTGANSYILASAGIPALNMQLHCISPMSDILTVILQHRTWVWVLTILAMLLMTVYILYYYRFIMRPINTIFESVHRAEETGHFLIEKRDVVFDDIYAQFTGMVDRIKLLAATVYEEQFRAQKAELRQLQMQINPHFFYNTLFMIYRMAQAEGNEKIAQVSLNLSNYYRYITKTPGHDVPLKEEVAHVVNYLEIQRLRFSPRVTIQIDEFPEALSMEEIPPLMLQPIVENAFVHGVKNRTSDGFVALHFEYTDMWYRVMVCDNGNNMDEEAVCELNRRLKCGEMEEGSALQNLNRRMQLRYGGKYELVVESNHQGLCVSVTFPRKGETSHAVSSVG